jgi:DNA-binding beta-propeller fold protein YncE
MPRFASIDSALRRRVVIGAALAAPLVAASRAAGGQTPTSLPLPRQARSLFVLNSLDANVQVLDPAGTGEQRRVPVLREPHHLVLTPARDLILVGDSGANEMFLLDPRSGEVRRREAISNPYNLGFTPDGRRLVVTSLRRNQVDIYRWDGTTLGFEGRLLAGRKPSHVSFSPDSRHAFVTLQGDDAAIAIDLETRTEVWRADVGREPAGILWHRGRILVGVMGGDFVTVIDAATRQADRRIPVGRGAHAVFESPQDGLIYVTSRVDSRITALDPVTLDVRRVHEIGGGPDCLTFDADGSIWATLRWTGRIAKLDPRSGAVQTTRVGRSPHGILFTPGAMA